MRLIYALLALVLVILAVPTAAQSFDPEEWAQIGSTRSGTKIYAQISDLNAGRPDSTAARVWIRMDASKDTSVAFFQSTSLYVVNCVAQTYTQVQVTTYDRSSRANTTKGDMQLQFVIPGTHMDKLQRLLCAPPAADDTPNYR